MAGGIDLLSGSSALGSANLFSIDKNPLNELDAGIEDVVGQQASDAGGQLTSLVGVLTNAIIGLPLDLLGEFAGTAGDLSTYFGNLEMFLGDLNPLSPTFDPIAAAEVFITTVLNPTGLLATAEGIADSLIGVFTDAIGGLSGLSGLGSIFGDLTGLLGNPTALGSGSPGIPGIGSIPLLGGLLNEGLTILESLIPGLDATQIVSGSFPISMIEGLAEELEQVIASAAGSVEAGVGAVVDELYNAIQFGAGASGVPLGVLGSTLGQLAQDVQTGISLATRAFDVTQQFGGLLHQFIDELPVVPIYQGWEHFLEQMALVVATTVGNIFTSLSPQNPPVAEANNQIAALWAHVSAANTAGIHYSFDSSVSLTDNYPGTTHPSWLPLTGFSLPTVPPGAGYAVDTTTHIDQPAWFTGNPNNAATDHGLVTDRNQVYMTLGIVPFGSAIIWCSGHVVSGTLGQNVEIELDYGGPAAIRLYTCTGMNSGRTQRTFDDSSTQYDLPTAPKPGDVWGVQHDGAGVYTVYYNNMPVKVWTDSGAVLTHGVGFRECGFIATNLGGPPAQAIGQGSFTALDYT